jgi:hypothetical protein
MRKNIIRLTVLAFIGVGVVEAVMPGPYWWNMLIATDQLANTTLAGDPDDTISQRLGRAQQEGSWFADVACSFLDLFEDDHCQKSLLPVKK